MQWPPGALPFAAAAPADHQMAKHDGPCPMTFGCLDDGDLDGSLDASMDTAMDVTLDQNAALMALIPMDRSQLYDLAEMLLSEMIPGWDEDVDDDEEDDDDDDLDWEEDEVVEAAPRVVADPVLDASYRACILEAERYLVQCEGLDAQGAVIADLKDYLHEAREQAVNGRGAQERHRAPGYP